MSELIQSGDCCNPCTTPSTVSVPGQKGDDGADGADGVNAYSYTLASFQVPAASGTVQVSIGSTLWMAAGQPVFFEGGFWGVVNAAPGDANTVTILNPGYAANVAPGTTINAGAAVTPSGLPGAQADELMVFGTTEIPNGVSTYTVTGLSLADDPDQVVMTLRVPNGQTVLYAAIEEGTISSDGFKVLLNTTTPAAGYKIDWIAKLP